MAIITADYETYYSTEYSLRRMTTAEYILDPRFQTIMCAIKVDQGPTETYVGHDEVARKLGSFDWTKCAFLSHNTRFDGAILAWRYGITPALYLDTLSMARATTHPVLGKSSLAAVSKYLGLPDKGDEVVKAMGKRLEDFTPDELTAYRAYCVRDNENCRLIFDRMRKIFSDRELRTIDTVLRMYIEPSVKLDANALASHLAQVRADKAAVMATVAHLDPAVFSSNQKFTALLEEHGVEAPTKISPTTGLLTPALAKNDRAFKELCADPDQPPAVQALLAARLGSKSTIEETRTATLLKASGFEWPYGRGTGWGLVALKYSGAHTHRFSGDDGTNYQNFKRGSMIREGIVAPDGYRIVHRDSSQIEARMVAFLAGCGKLLHQFERGDDTYSIFASSVYGIVVTKADKQRRFVGKTSILGLGYQCGWKKFRHTLFIGNGGLSLDIDEAEAQRIVYAYRRLYPEIPQLWATGDAVAAWMVYQSDPGFRRRTGSHLAFGSEPPVYHPAVSIDADAIWLPSGLCINYPNVHVIESVDPHTGNKTKEVVYDGPYGEPRKLYGGKILENVSQALARIVLTDIIDRVRTRLGYLPFLSTHDSLDYCVPLEEADYLDKELDREFAIRPTWAAGLPLASEGGWGTTLAAAERMENR